MRESEPQTERTREPGVDDQGQSEDNCGDLKGPGPSLSKEDKIRKTQSEGTTRSGLSKGCLVLRESLIDITVYRFYSSCLIFL